MVRELNFVTKPDCHLCDDARVVVDRVLAELSVENRPVLHERSILEDADLNARYAELIPVVLLDGRQHSQWRVDAPRLRAALVGDLPA